MPIDDFLLIGSTLSAVFLALFFLVFWPVPRASVMFRAALAIALPIVVLSGYFVVGYRTWNRAV